MEKKKNRVAGFFLGFLPMLAAFGCQMLVSVVGQIIYTMFATIRIINEGGQMDVDILVADMLGNSTYLGAVMMASELAMILCAALWYFLAYGKKDAGLKTINFKTILFAIFCGIAMQAIISLALTVVFTLLPESVMESYSELTDSILDTNSWWYIVSVALLAPLAEELFFRGITLKMGLNYFGKVGAVILQAFMFGALHVLCGMGSSGTIVQGIYAFALGLVFGFIAVKFNSVWPTFLLHAAVNGSAVLLTVAQENISKPEIVTYAMIPIGLVMLGLALLVYSKIQFNTIKEK